MGWLFMSRGGMAPFATPKAYLDNQCTYPPDPEKGRETRARYSRSSASLSGTPAREAARSLATRTVRRCGAEMEYQ